MSYRTAAAEEHTACAACVYRKDRYCDADPLAEWHPVQGWLMPTCVDARREHPITCPHYRARPRCTAEQHLGPIRVGLITRLRVCIACGDRVGSG